MRDGAWRGAAALAAVAALIVAGCGGGGGNEGTPTPSKSSSKAPVGAKAGRRPDGDVRRRRRLHRPAASRTTSTASSSPTRRSGRCTRTSRTTRRTRCPTSPTGPPEISDGRQDRHGQDQAGVKFCRRSTARSRPRTSSTRSSAASCRTSTSGYVGAYLGDLEGLKAYQDGKAKDIAGIKTPDDHDDRLQARPPARARSSPARSRCPASAPVPKEYAQKFDDARRHVDVRQHQVATGPYMIENDASGKLTGYKPGSVIDLVRNPNWDKSHRLQARLPRRDHDQGGQRRRRRVPPDPRAARAWSRATSSCPPAILSERLAGAARRTSWS